MRRRHLESVSAALYGSTFQHLLKSPIRIQPQLSGKGVLGHSPKRILVPFVRIKGTARRRAAQTLHPAKSTRRRQATTNLAPAGQAYSLCLCKRLRAATSLPLAQGSLWVCRQARRNLFSPITKKKQPFGCFFLVRVVIQNFLKKPVISTVFKADE